MKLIKILTVLSLMVLGANAGAASWSYSGPQGPNEWGSLAPAFELCAKGDQQSPIELNRPVLLNDSHLRLHYHSAAFYLRQSAHNLYQDNSKLGKNYLVYNGQTYNLLEIHFHVPAEHRVNAQQYPMEVHLVHQNSKNQLLVLAIFLKIGSANSYLAALLNSPELQALNEEVRAPLQLNPLLLNPTDLLGRAKEYYVYEGSLTTPPCTEGVTWIIAKDPIELSAQQLSEFKSQVTSFNARPLQKLDGRKLGFKA